MNDKSKLLVNPRALYERLVLVNQTFETTRQSNFSVSWTPAADDPQTLVSILPKWDGWYNGSGFQKGDNVTCTICTVSAFWRNTITTFELEDGIFRIKPEMPDLLHNISGENLRPITISPTLMEGLDDLQFYFVNRFTARILATNVTKALTTLSNIAWEGQDPDTQTAILKGYERSQLKGSAEVTPFSIVTTNYGFGYGIRDTSTQLSLAVITAYCLIVVTYVGYIIATGLISIAWSSPTELVMLALQSREPSNLGHVSVGIDSTETLRRNVGIRVSQVEIKGTGEAREKLELVFEEDDENEKRGLMKVVRNRAY